MQVVGDDKELLALASDFARTVNQDLGYTHYQRKGEPVDKFSILRMLTENRDSTAIRGLFSFLASSIRSKTEAAQIKAVATAGPGEDKSELLRKLEELKNKRQERKNRLKELKE